MEHNLTEVTRFHGYLRNGLKRLYRDAENDPGVIADLENYDDYLSSNTFLMAYSYLEEYLYLIWKHRARGQERKRGFSIDRYEEILKGLGVSPHHQAWQFLLKATDIRHCLLHANGRLSFMKKPSSERMRDLIREFAGEMTIKTGDRLAVNVHFLSRFVDNVRELQGAIDAARR